MKLMILRADKDSFSGESLWEERSWECEPPRPPKIGHATDYREGEGESCMPYCQKKIVLNMEDITEHLGECLSTWRLMM